MSRRRPLVALFLIAACVGAWWAWRRTTAPLPPGVTRAEFERAADEFAARYHRPPDGADVVNWLAESAVAAQRWQTALACFREIPADHPRYGLAARFQQAEVLLELDRAAEAEQQFRAVLDLDQPGADADERRLASREWLVYLLGVQLRFEDQQQVLADLVDRGEADAFHTLRYCFPTIFRWNGTLAAEELDEYLRAAPHDRGLRLAAAQYRAAAGRIYEAEQLSAACLAEAPHDRRALAVRLYVLHAASRWDELHRLLETTPPAAPADPGLRRLLRGHAAAHAGDRAAAIAAYRHVLEGDPASAEAWSGLARAATAPDDAPLRDDALRRARALARIQGRLGWSGRQPNDPAPLVEIAQLCAESGFPEFAALVATQAVHLDPDNAPAREVLASLPQNELHAKPLRRKGDDRNTEGQKDGGTEK